MRAPIALLVLSLAPFLGAQVRSPQLAPLVRVTQGEAQLADAGELLRLRVGQSDRPLGPGGHVELGLHSRVELRLPRRMHMQVRDHSSFGLLQPGASDVDLHAQFLFLGNADIELRRGHLVLDLPQAWRLELGRGSFYIKELSNGDIELSHRAGEPIQVTSLAGDQRGVSKGLAAGQNILLPAL